MNPSNPSSNKRTSGSGSAHLRFGMFGARGPLMDEHESGSGSSGSAAPTTPAAGEATTTTAATPPPAGAAPQTGQAGKVQFTPEQQAEVNRLVGSARDEGRRSVSRQQQQPQTPPAPAATTEPTLQSIAAQLEEERQRREFTELAADHGWPKTVRGVLFDLYKTQRPGDPTAWASSMAETFGFNKQAAGSTATPSTTAAPAGAHSAPAAGAAQPTAPQGQQPPAAAPSAPNGNAMPMAHGVVDIFQLSREELSSLGPAGVRKSLDALTALGRQMQGAPARPKVPSRQ